MFHRFHRRAPSNPTSPLPDQATPWEAAAIHEHPLTAQDVMPRPDMRPRSSTAVNTPPSLPPSLPPIPRVASVIEPDYEVPDQDPGPRPARSPYHNSDLGFMGGVSFQNYLRGVPEPGRPQSSGDVSRSLPQSHLTRSKPPPPPINTNFAPRPPPVPLKQGRHASSFVTPTDLQTSVAASKQPSGTRPSGTRFASEPAGLSATHAIPENHRAKKLPFLKNPMSNLLGRKRAGQNVQEEAQPPVPSREEIYAPIRGTRVHDFSAPRNALRPPRRLISNDIPQVGPSTGEGRPDEWAQNAFSSQEHAAPRQYPEYHERQSSQPGHGIPVTDAEPQRRSGVGRKGSEQSLQERVRISLEQKPLPDQPMPSVPPKDAAATLRGTSSSNSRTASLSGSTLPRSTPSAASRASRNASLSRVSVKDGVMTAVPRHMKSTSSRFSFMVGSANQEKLMEERHRQKELEKKTADPPSNVQRDSRFDDFDEDSFDYDAMMDDDGLEEAIPGVNTDIEEEDDFEEPVDPDNDQDNFAGFVFQRSNQASTLPTPITPNMIATPRDASGKVIGFAMTKDSTTPDLHRPPSASPIYLTDPELAPKTEDEIAGLGIHAIVEHSVDQNADVLRQNRDLPSIKVAPNEDDLYFDQGLADELNFEGAEAGVPFDESIFDSNDTDQYGRPIPGAFAQAQAMRASMSQEPANKPQSDATSRLSDQSQLSQSTAHTSVSVGPQHFPTVTEKQVLSDSLPPHQEQPLQQLELTEAARVVAYQAALANAAHKAAASGKFRRGSSPPPVTDLVRASPAPDAGLPVDYSHRIQIVDDYDDDPYAQNMDDYDLDDDDIIAAANAEALANDMDGFYGQEFGFYSGPNQGHPGHSHTSSSSSTGKGAGSAQLNAQNLFEYSNGGYFGPSGVGRSGSGRIISREPNLTPITERSEYSNRNSIMSLGLPPIGSGGDLRSPGLAQLAMMADDGDMTLSALMRLRNKAFGGSQASLAPSSREGSPQSAAGEREGALSPWGAQSGYLTVRDGPHGRKNSATAHSIRSRDLDSDAGSGSGSPTLTVNFPVPGMSPLPIPAPLFSPPSPLPPQPSPLMMGGGCLPVLEDEEVRFHEGAATGSSSMSGSGVWMKSPTADSTQSNITTPSLPLSASSQARRPGMGHRHKGSADSISYTKEKGEDRETRWIVERRRTAESGEVEILGRQVVDGGRI